MKRFLTKASTPLSQSTPDVTQERRTSLSSSPYVGDSDHRMSQSQRHPRALSANNLNNLSATAGLVSRLQPKDMLPPLPHPNPYDHLVVVPTKQGLLLRPQVPTPHDGGGPASFIKIAWKKGVTIEEVDSRAEGMSDVDWKSGIVIYGIVGALELFSCTFLLFTLPWVFSA